MFGPQSLPFGPFGGQHFRFEHRQGDEGGDEPQQGVTADVELPEGGQAEFFPRAVPTGQAHAAPPAEHGDFAELVVAVIGAEVGAEALAELLQAFPRALAGRVVAQPDEGGVAGVIAVGDDVIEGGAAFEELVEEMVLAQRLPQPDEMAKEAGEGAGQGISDAAKLEVLAARLFGGAGVMNVAQDAERAGAHGAHVEEQSRRGQSGRSREQDLEGGALAGAALHADGAPMLQDDAPRDRQAQAGAFGFGGEERLEQAGHVLRRNAGARVFDRNPKLRPGQRNPLAWRTWRRGNRFPWRRTECRSAPSLRAR